MASHQVCTKKTTTASGKCSKLDEKDISKDGGGGWVLKGWGQPVSECGSHSSASSVHKSASTNRWPKKGDQADRTRGRLQPRRKR